jgi:hypothetical protein
MLNRPSIIHQDEENFPSRTSYLSRSFKLFWLYPSGRLSNTAGCLSLFNKENDFFSKHIYGKTACYFFASFYVWTKILVCKDASQGFYYSEVFQSQKIFGSLSAVKKMCHPVRTPIYHCSIRQDDVPYRPDARQTKHHPFGRRAFSSGPSTMSRSLCSACICLEVSVAHPDASLYSTSFKFFPSS